MKPQTTSVFDRFATTVAQKAGSTAAFSCAFAAIVIWALCGPVFGFSETWQLVINTGTTIVTFLMVFLIQKAQNKDSLAIQLKLNELVAAHKHSSNRLIDIESMTEEEMRTVQKYYQELSKLSETEESLQVSHSVEEARESHERKQEENEEEEKGDA